MTFTSYLVLMIAWWTASGITKFTGLGMQPYPEMEPRAGGMLKLLIFPAVLGSWVYPLYSLIAGNLAWWQTVVGVLLGVFCALWVPRILVALPGGVLLLHPLAVLLSLIGVGVFLVTH